MSDENIKNLLSSLIIINKLTVCKISAKYNVITSNDSKWVQIKISVSMK